jgi:hypothetical protein
MWPGWAVLGAHLLNFRTRECRCATVSGATASGATASDATAGGATRREAALSRTG